METQYNGLHTCIFFYFLFYLIMFTYMSENAMHMYLQVYTM